MEKQIPAPKFEMHPDMLSDAEIDARLAELGWGFFFLSFWNFSAIFGLTARF